MHVVALTELASPVDTEAAALAADLGTTLYEERLKLAGGLPVIVLTSADASRAHGLGARLRSRGHGVVTCDASDVVSSGAMTSMRRFALLGDAVAASDEQLLPYREIIAIIRASHQIRTETRTETKSKEFSAGRALLSGGLMLRKSVTREEKSVSHEREQVLYLFGKRSPPWILQERGTHYAGLGALAGPSSTQNFAAAVTELRKRAPQAFYDERLLTPRKAPTRSVRTGGSGSESLAVSSVDGVDLLAHLLAQWAREKNPRISPA